MQQVISSTRDTQALQHTEALTRPLREHMATVFHVTTGLPSVMHDILKGSLQHQGASTLSHMGESCT